MVQQLKIPPDVKDSILPNKNISIVDFLQFPLPDVAATSPSIGQPKSFYSTLYPTITDPEIIQKILLPPLPILERLSQIIDLANTRSIICQHASSLQDGAAGHRLPIWVLTFWREVARIWPLKKKWVLARETLETRKTDETRTHTNETKMLISQVGSALACIPWSGNIKGFPGDVPTEYLTRYMTDDWLTDEHENQMLHLLERELARSGHSDGIHVAETFLITRLLEIYRHPDRDEHYATAKNNAWLRRWGQELGTGVLDKLVAIVNLDQNHWVSVVIDAPSSRILYGDSLGKPITREVKGVLTWWINHHTATNFQIDNLAITCQEDGWSCGMLAWNAIAAHVLPETYSLVNGQAVVDERLKMLLRVVERHNEMVRVCSCFNLSETNA
jgi:hypothetical protein